MHRLFRFGPFELDSEKGVLRKFGVRVTLQPQPLAILTSLLERQGELVTRAELRTRLWDPNVFVDFEHSLNRSMNKLRIALNDTAEQHQWIERVPGRGYRFVGQCEVIREIGNHQAIKEPLSTVEQPSVSSTAPDPTPANSPLRFSSIGSPQVIGAMIVLIAIVICVALLLNKEKEKEKPALRRLVVLPVVNLTGDQGSETVADGLTEDLTTAIDLSGNHLIGVVARTSSMKYKNVRKGAADIGKELRAEYVLESSLRRSGNQFRLVSQLIRTADEQHVWSSTLERSGEDSLVVCSELSLAVADGVSGVLLGGNQHQQRASVRTAEYAYIKGHFHWNKRTKQDLETSLLEFREAATLDPSYARAYAGISEALLVLGGGYLPSKPTYQEAREQAEEALKLDPSCSDAHAALGYVKFISDYDWKGAESEFREAIRLDPTNATTHHWFAIYLAAFKRYSEALAQIEEAVQLEPLSAPIRYNKGMILIQAGQLAAAEQELKEAINLEPNSPVAYGYLAIAAERRGDFEAAAEMFGKAQEVSQIPLHYAAGIAHAEAMLGHRKKAEAILARMLELRTKHPDMVGSYSLVLVYAALGDKEKALKWLDRSVVDQTCTVTELNTDPALEPIRKDPAFREIASKMNLSP